MPKKSEWDSESRKGVLSEGWYHPRIDQLELRKIVLEGKDPLLSYVILPDRHLFVLPTGLAVLFSIILYPGIGSWQVRAFLALTWFGTWGTLNAETNASHATNPLWMPHARFHHVWQLITRNLMTAFTFWHWFNARDVRVPLFVSFAMISGHLLSIGFGFLYGGRAADPNGVRPYYCCGRELDTIWAFWPMMGLIWTVTFITWTIEGNDYETVA